MSAPFLKAVCNAMERIAPLRLAEPWDNVGLLLEAPSPRLNRHKVMLTIDLTTAVCAEALEAEASVIVAYHPTIFKGLKSLTLSNPLQASLLRCASEGISVYSPHTALDSVWGGINDWLVEGILGQDKAAGIGALVVEKVSSSGTSEGGEGRLVMFDSPLPVSALESRIKKHLNLSLLQVGYPTVEAERASVRSVAICAGSGGSMLLGKDADVYFTGEMSHHEVLAAVAAGKHVILCGHTNTERGYLSILAAKLRDELGLEKLGGEDFEGVDILVSKMDEHPLKYV